MAVAKKLVEIRNSTVGSEELLYFVKVPTDLSEVDAWNDTNKAFHMALLMAESNTMDSGVETDDPADVTSKVASHVIKSYKKTFTHSGVFLKDDPVCRFEEYIVDHEETGAKASVELIALKTYDGNKAYKYQAVCEVTSAPGGDAQDKLKIEATYTIISEAVEGTATYDKETGVAEFTPKSNSL